MEKDIAEESLNIKQELSYKNQTHKGEKKVEIYDCVGLSVIQPFIEENSEYQENN